MLARARAAGRSRAPPAEGDHRRDAGGGTVQGAAAQTLGRLRARHPDVLRRADGARRGRHVGRLGLWRGRRASLVRRAAGRPGSDRHLGHGQLDADLLFADADRHRQAVEGGFRFSGRWKYASGCEHCAWAFLGGTVEGQPDDRRIFVIPQSDYEIVDTWHVPGLKGTGSHDIVIKDAFVPEYRTQKYSDNFRGYGPGLAAEHLAALPAAVRAGVLSRRLDRGDRRAAGHARCLSRLRQEAHRPRTPGGGVGGRRDPVALRRDRGRARRDEDHPAPQLQSAGGVRIAR